MSTIEAIRKPATPAITLSKQEIIYELKMIGSDLARECSQITADPDIMPAVKAKSIGIRERRRQAISAALQLLQA